MSRSLLHGGIDHGAPLSPEEYNTLLGLKIGCIGLIPALSFCGALAPLFSKQIRQNTTAISYCNVLAGSILLGFGFLHILPDAVESFSEWDESVNHFPIVYAMVMVGFFVVLLIEKLLILRIEKLAAERRRAKEMKKIELAAPDVADKIEDEECSNCGDCKDVSDKSSSSRISQRDLLQRRETEEVVVDLEASKSNHDHHGHDHHDHDHHDHAHAFHTHDVPMDNESKSATPYVLTIGLAFHSIFEGLALAFAGSIDAMVLLLIGIGLHKFAEGFAMGSSLVKMDLRLRRCLLLVAAFCIVLPIGVAIGLGLGEALDEDALNLTMSLTNSFAVGVFIYIAILGVYVEELAGKNHVFAKIGLALVMCLTMGCLSLLEA